MIEYVRGRENRRLLGWSPDFGNVFNDSVLDDLVFCTSDVFFNGLEFLLARLDPTNRWYYSVHSHWVVHDEIWRSRTKERRAKYEIHSVCDVTVQHKLWTVQRSWIEDCSRNLFHN
jgi:hypothetical protein